MVTRRVFIAVLAVGAALVAGCSADGSGGGDLPDGAVLLEEAAEASRDIGSAHFTLKVDGEVPDIPVQQAEGELTREGGPEGAAKGTVTLTLLGQLIEGEFVLVDGDFYIQGPTGGFQQVPSALGASVYDPSAILDPETGIANVLANIQDPVSRAREDVDGAAAIRVEGRATREVVSSLVPGVDSDVDISVWVREDTKQPAKASVTLPGSATVDITLSDVGAPVTVTPPA